MKKSGLPIFLILVTFLCPALLFASGDELELHFIDVGTGDSILIELPDGGNMLVDAGGPVAGPSLAAYLKDAGVERIDHLVFTHPHDDHIGGVFSLLSAFEVKTFYGTGFSNFRSTVYGDYLVSVRSDLSRYRLLQAGESFSFGTVEIDVINPLLPPTGNLNEDSIVLKVNYGDIAVLLAGDIGFPGERRLLAAGTALKSDVLKVGHHGALNVCSEEFLDAVGARAAVISVGDRNKYGRPRMDLLKRLEAAGTKVYRTDLNGHIILKTDGKTFSLHTEKNPEGESK